MTEQEAKNWVKNKQNLQAFKGKFFEDNKPVNAKVAFFMAGIPGAGKTEFADNTIRENSPELIPIEHDKLVEYIDGYKPEAYYNFRKAGSALVTCIFDECLKNGYAFVFDGTLSHENGMRNISKCLDKGYTVIIVYIVQDAAAAWRLTQAREIVKKRAIEKTGFLKTCRKINNNLATIFGAYKTNPKFSFWIIDKHEKKDLSKATAIFHSSKNNQVPEIENALQKEYNLDIT